MLCYTTYPSPVGTLTLAADETGQALAGLWLEGQKYFPACLERQAVCGGFPILDRAKKWLDRYFAGERPESGELPLVFRGSEFQQAVWEELRRIPYGETVTYGDLAAALARQGRRTSARAVGGAVGRNPISIIVPCHRVAGAGGGLTGYAGGLERKTWLLRHEGV